MDIEQPQSSLFIPLQPHQNNLLNSNPLASSYFSLSPQSTPTILLKIISDTLILFQDQRTPTCLPLLFQIKFQVIYLLQNDVTSQQIGIHLFDQQQKNIKIYASHQQISFWAALLAKRINVKGFHQMFKPLRKLGKGNFATVYQAQRVTDKKNFAVKAFSKQNSYSAKNGKQSLINELSLLRALNQNPHPNVLNLEAVYQSDNSIYVVLELLTGKTLFQKIQDRKGNFDLEQTKTIMRGLLKGLQHMKKNRVAHRDLKPQNIMLRQDSLQPVIVDFGLATNVDLQEYLFYRCGTPGYVAPQIIFQSSCQHIEPIVDVFSLGAIFHILLTRKPLFAGVKYDQVYKNNKEFKMRITDQDLKSVSQKAVSMLRQMLAINTNQRVCVQKALQHQFFEKDAIEPVVMDDGVEELTEKKISSPVMTSDDSAQKAKKKKTFFIF